MTNQNLKVTKPTVIKCPWCGTEYAPAELFNPTDLEGRPDSVLRDALGKIIHIDYPEGYEPETSAKYVCDVCEKPFIVDPVVTYKVRKEISELDFSDTTSSLVD